MVAAENSILSEKPSGAWGQPAKLLGIQYLRAVAALMVAYFHLCGQIAGYTGVLSGPAWFDITRLSGGVDIFFVISGFIMVVTSRNIGAGKFLWRRLIRIAPLYWVLTLILALIALVAPTVFKSMQFSVSALVRSLLFIPYQNAGQGGEMVPMLVPGWTLNVEMYFYAIFALTLTKVLRPYQVSIIAAFFCGMVMLRLADFSQAPLFQFYSMPRTLEFVAGVCLGRLALDGRVSMPIVPALLLLVGGAVMLLSGVPELGGIGVVIAPVMIVYAVLCIERVGSLPNLPWLGRLGDASYSIYLTHIFTLGFTRELWRHLPVHEGAAAAWAFAVFSMFVVVVVSMFSFRWIEQPLLRFFNWSGQRWNRVSV